MVVQFFVIHCKKTASLHHGGVLYRDLRPGRMARATRWLAFFSAYLRTVLPQIELPGAKCFKGPVEGCSNIGGGLIFQTPKKHKFVRWALFFKAKIITF